MPYSMKFLSDDEGPLPPLPSEDLFDENIGVGFSKEEATRLYRQKAIFKLDHGAMPYRAPVPNKVTKRKRRDKRGDRRSARHAAPVTEEEEEEVPCTDYTEDVRALAAEAAESTPIPPPQQSIRDIIAARKDRFFNRQKRTKYIAHSGLREQHREAVIGAEGPLSVSSETDLLLSGSLDRNYIYTTVRVSTHDTRRIVSTDIEKLTDELIPDTSSSDHEGDLLVPKLEPGLGDDEMLGMQGGLLARLRRTSEVGRSMPTTVKRPRGRPRKHPLPTIGELANKHGKGRSKTGCITCRKRKKKCDEAKPHCLNCEKNAVLCEGYPPLTQWRSGKEKAAFEGMDNEHYGGSVSLSPSSTHGSFQLPSPAQSLQPVIHGLETASDRLFFSHYAFRLSTLLTTDSSENNAFTALMLPMAVQHIGLMHSILALSASNIDWDTPYGQDLLSKYPELTVRELEDRAQYHNEGALREIHNDINIQNAAEAEGKPTSASVIRVRFGQMLCLVIKCLAEGDTGGAHRMHLQAYESFVRETPWDDSPFMKFIHKYFQHQLCFDLLASPPSAYPVLTEAEFWVPRSVPVTLGPMVPPHIKAALTDNSILSERCGGLFGLQQDIYNTFMRRIGMLRHDIRTRMAAKEEPFVNCRTLHQAAALDAEIRGWADAPPPPAPSPSCSASQKRQREHGENLYRVGILYKQMLWVYLYRTIYPPTSSSTGSPPGFSRFVVNKEGAASGRRRERDAEPAVDPRVKHAVDHAIQLLQSFAPQDPCQTLLLSPAFLIGCAAFGEAQRSAIRRVVRGVRRYTSLRNAEPAERVLEEVWRRMDGRGDEGADGEGKGVLRNSRGERDGGRESSWDWQGVARDLEVDFLAT